MIRPIRRASFRCGLPVLLALVGMLFLTSSTSAQPAKVPLGQDTHAFRHVLKQAGLKALAGFGGLSEEPDRSVLILFGKTEQLDSIEVDKFLKKGGAVLVATDNPNQSHSVARDFGVEVHGPLPPAASDPVIAYRGLPECPFAQPLAGEEDVAIFRGLRHVATNRPAFLEFGKRIKSPQVLAVRNALRLLAVLPFDIEIRQGKRLIEVPTPFAIGGRVGDGRVLILSDHSVFLNDMMLPRDNDNFDFAVNVVEWLRDASPSQKRDRVLYVEEGTIRTDFEVKWKQVLIPPLPPPEDLLQLGDQLVSGLEKEGYFRDLERRNVFNDTLLSEFGLNSILRGVAITLTLGLLVYGGYRLVRGRQGFEGGAPLFALALARSTPQGMAAQQRHQSLMKQRNLWEPARELARQCLEPLLLEASRRAVGDPLPAIVAEGGWWRRRQWRRRALRLWQLAYAQRPVPVSAREFTRLLEQAEEFKAAFHNGTVRLVEPLGSRRPS